MTIKLDNNGLVIDSSQLHTVNGIVTTNAAGELISSIDLINGTTATTQSASDNSTKVSTTAYVDAAVGGENLWDRTTGTPNYLLPHTAADDLGATAAKITKGWLVDIESTNMPTVSGTSINANAVLDLTSDEVTQLATIGTSTISSDQWGYLGGTNQGVASTDTVTFANVTATTNLTITNGVFTNNSLIGASSSESVDDLGTIDLAAGVAGYGTVQAGDDEEWATFSFTSAGVVTLRLNTANVVTADTDGKLCIVDAGTNVQIINQLGVTKTIRYTVYYS